MPKQKSPQEPDQPTTPPPREAPEPTPSETQPPGEPTTRPTTDPSEASLWTRKRLTSDWGGVRTDMENAGISFSLTYQQIFMTNMHGGLEPLSEIARASA